MLRIPSGRSSVPSSVARCCCLTALFALMWTPHVARAQNLFVSNFVGNTIQEFSPTGTDLGTFSTGLNGPIGLAFNSSGDLFVSNFGRNAGDIGTIHEFSPTGADLGTFAATGPNSAPTGLAFNSSGDLFVIEGGNNTIHEFSPTGTDLGTFASTGLDGPEDLALDKNGNIYVANAIGTIHEFSPTGTDLGTFASTGVNVEPVGLAFNKSGDLFVSYFLTHAIEEFSPTGTDLGTFASTGLDGPGGLAFNSSGNLFATNPNGDIIEEFSPTGTDLGTFASTGKGPIGLAFSPTSVVPEGSSLALLGGGLLPIAAFLRKKRRSSS